MEIQTKFTLSEIRELYEAFESDFRSVLELIISNDYEISKIIESQKEYGFDINAYYEECNGFLYSDSYRVDHYGNISHIDELFWCEHYEEYFPDNECNTVYDGSNNQYWSDRAISKNILYNYRDEYYTERGLEYNDLVIMDSGEIESINDVYYWECDGDYHYEPEVDEDEEYEEYEEYTRSYHNGSFKSQSFNDKSKYTIGFEIEKEDADIKESIYISDFEDDLPNWRKEQDGSLDQHSGFELISPIFEFDIKEIFTLIEDSTILKKHINANFSRNCGGHINLGHKDKTGMQVFELVSGYIPLLYSLYYGRIDKNYSKAKSINDLKEDNEKYQAIKIHSNRIEFRIFSAVSNVDTLKWRCELINLMLKYPTNDVKKAFYYIETRFTNVLSKQYKTKYRLIQLKNRIKDNSMKFENIDLNNLNK